MNAMRTATALCNARVLTPDGFVEGLAVLMQDGRIADLVADDAIPSEAVRHDLHGATLLPGFIDAQVNGGGGALFNNDTSVEAIRTIAQAHRRFGTTGLLPTLISDDAEVMARAIAATRQAIAQGVPGVLGIHLEGPYIAPARKGTHDAAKFRVPGADEIAMATSLDNGVTLLTLAPEQVPADTIRTMVARGAIVFAGHTAGTYEQIRAGIEAGVSGFTHLYNAMSPLQGREPGAVGAALEDDGCWCGVVFLVTDAMPMVGADDPSFDLYGETITAVDGVVRNAAGALAGSALDMASAVRNCVRRLDLPLEEAARMASTYPADLLGLGATHGRIAPGYRADLVALDDDLQVVGTWIGGA